MKNKEAIEKLVEYFRIHSNFETTARILANLMIDMNRVMNLKELEEEERNCLVARMIHNNSQFVKFIKEGSKTPLKFENIHKASDVP